MNRWVVILLVAACSKSKDGGSASGTKTSKASAKVFECYRVGRGAGAAWRECAISLSDCANTEKGGCFQREDAFCFPYMVVGFGDQPDMRGMICTPSKEECDEWHEDRLHVPDKALGPCAVMRPDEYPEDLVKM